jgi:ribonuclease HII
MAPGLTGFDRRAIGAAPCLVGIDEAGRGCLAGPVVAAAIRCEAAFYRTSWLRRHSRGVDDSKRLSAAQRQAVVERFKEACHENWIRIGIGAAGVEEIERHNIFQATALAMRRAVLGALGWDAGDVWELGNGPGREVGKVLIDGRPIKGFPLEHEGVVKGDQRSLAVALAGIHAKEWRDARMRELDAEYPGYGFAVHKGYGTAAHLAALRRLGPCPHHRPTFLRKFHAGAAAATDRPAQGQLFQPHGAAFESTECSLF